jgi:hypothetical protein
MPLFSGFRPTAFEVHATYRSAADPARRYEVRTAGAYPKGADMAESYRGSIVVSAGDTRRQLTVDAERFTPRVEHVDWPADAAPTGAIDAAFLALFIMAVDSGAGEEQARKEAGELLAVLQAAGMGPKVGLPGTKVLLLVSASSDYL